MPVSARLAKVVRFVLHNSLPANAAARARVTSKRILPGSHVARAMLGILSRRASRWLDYQISIGPRSPLKAPLSEDQWVERIERLRSRAEGEPSVAALAADGDGYSAGNTSGCHYP